MPFLRFAVELDLQTIPLRYFQRHWRDNRKTLRVTKTHPTAHAVFFQKNTALIHPGHRANVAFGKPPIATNKTHMIIRLIKPRIHLLRRIQINGLVCVHARAAPDNPRFAQFFSDCLIGLPHLLPRLRDNQHALAPPNCGHVFLRQRIAPVPASHLTHTPQTLQCVKRL